MIKNPVNNAGKITGKVLITNMNNAPVIIIFTVSPRYIEAAIILNCCAPEKRNA